VNQNSTLATRLWADRTQPYVSGIPLRPCYSSVLDEPALLAVQFLADPGHNRGDAPYLTSGVAGLA
jgi:hypothetical protein